MKVSTPLAVAAAIAGVVAGVLESPGTPDDLLPVGLLVGASVAVAVLLVGPIIGGLFGPIIEAVHAPRYRAVALLGMAILAVALGAYLVPVLFSLLARKGRLSSTELADAILLGSYGLAILGPLTLIVAYLMARLWFRVFRQQQ